MLPLWTAAAVLVLPAAGRAAADTEETDAAGSVSDAADPGGRAADTEAVAVMTLAEVLRAALLRASMIRAAEARVDMARAMPDQVSAYPVPVVGIRAMDWPGTPMGDWEIQYMVSQMFPLTDVLERRREAAEAAVDAVRAEAASVELDIVLEIRLAYVELARTLAERAVIDDQERTMRRMAGIAAAAYASGAGMGTAADTMRARAEIAMLEGDRRMAEAMALAARAMIAAAAALEPHETVVDPAPIDLSAFEPPTPADTEDLLAESLANRPEFAAFDALGRQAEAAALAAGDERVPDLMLEAGIQQRIGGDMPPVAFMLGASIPIPWLSPGRYRGMEAEARAQARMVRADADALGLSIGAALRTLAASHDQAVAGIEASRGVIRILRGAARSAETAYLSGTGDFDSILNLQARVLEIRRLLVRYVFETFAIRARVDRVVARPVAEQIASAEVRP